MPSSHSLVASLVGLLGTVAASPMHSTESGIAKRAFSCDTLVSGLSLADCQQMSNIGMAGQGTNALGNNGNIWIGTDGPNTFTFKNTATDPIGITLFVWYNAPNDYQSSFMNVRTPMVSYSLPNVGDTVTVSLADGVSGGFSTINAATTALSQYGQIDNTWGEFTTGAYATIDISREVNMLGNVMDLTVGGNGCHADMNTCAFTCKSGNTCGESGTYDLVNCANGSQPGASYGLYDGNPSGGCQGWSNGGHVDVNLGRS